MSAHARTKVKEFTDLVNQKEQEWKNLLQNQLESLSKELAERDNQVRLENIRFHKLKEDFEYNLSLLAERDKELERYDELFQQLKANDTLRNAEVSEMKIKVDEAETRYRHLEKETAENQRHYQMRLHDYQEEMNKFYTKKEDEMQVERSEYEMLKKNLNQKIRDVEEDYCFEKQKLLNEFNDTSKQKEATFRLQLDKKDGEIHSLLLKVKMLTKELDIIKENFCKNNEDLDANKEATSKVLKCLKQKDWELADMENMHKVKLQEIALEQEALQKAFKSKEEELIRKCDGFQKHSIENERMYSDMKEKYDENDLKLRNEMKGFQKKIEEQELFIKTLQWNIIDQMNVKDKLIEKLKEDACELRLKHSQELEHLYKNNVAKDVQLEALSASEGRLKQDIFKMKEDINRYKKDLSSAMEREKMLENAKTQLEMEWRRRYENKESDLYHEHEHLIKQLTTAKTEALSKCENLTAELTQRDHLIQSLQTDKHKALKELQHLGIDSEKIFIASSTPSKEEGVGASSSDDLIVQNQHLKDVIKQMRGDMEMLIQQSTSSRTSTPDSKIKKSDYVADMESQLREMKTKNRALENKLDDHKRDCHSKPPSGRHSPKLTNTIVQSHIKELNETISVLRNDKIQLTALLKSKDANIVHLKDGQYKLEQDKHKLEAAIEGLKYDLNSATKAKQDTTKSMKTKIEELELLLQQSRSEAEIYYKGIVEQNLNAAQVNSKLSELKLQQTMTSSQPYQTTTITAQTPNVADSQLVKNLKTKLKIAVERIRELTTERSQLINASNKLRAQLTQTNASSSRKSEANLAKSSNSKSKGRDIRQYKETVDSKLAKLAGEIQAQSDYSTESDVLVFVESTQDNSSSMSQDNAEYDELDQSMVHDSLMMSSSGHSSIKEIWKLLEEDNISTPGTTMHSKDKNDGSIAVVGQHLTAQQRKEKDGCSRDVRTIKNIKKPKPKMKIRNYNKKD